MESKPIRPWTRTIGFRNRGTAMSARSDSLPGAGVPLTIGVVRPRGATPPAETHHADRHGPARHDPRRLHRHRCHGPVDVPAHHDRWVRHDSLLADEVEEPAAV